MMKPTLCLPGATALLSLAALLSLGACGEGTGFDLPEDEMTALRPPPGSNQMLRAPVSVATGPNGEGLEVIISDVVIPPNATVPRHYHPGEEFLYVIEGSAIHVEAGKPDRVLEAGDAYVIPPRAQHAPRGGPDGARGIVFRVHVAGQPERILTGEDGEPLPEELPGETPGTDDQPPD